MGKGQYCCIPGCFNNTSEHKGVSFSVFPVDESLKSQWIKLINRKGKGGKFSLWKPTAHHKVCGYHFNPSGKRTYADKLPIYLPQGVYKQSEVTIRRKRKRRPRHTESTEPYISDVCQLYEDTPLCPCIESDNIDVGAEVVVESRPMPRLVSVQTTHYQNAVRTPAIPHEDGDHSYAITLSPDQEIRRLNNTVIEVISENEELNGKVNSYKREQEHLKQQLEDMVNKPRDAENKNRELGLSLINLDMEKKVIEENASKVSNRVDSYINAVICDEKKLQFYTSFESVKKFNIFTEFVEPGYREARYRQRSGLQPNKNIGRPQAIGFKGQLVMILMRLRLGLLEKDLAYRFEVSVGTVSNICSFWLDFLSTYLESVPIWPSRQVIDKYMPQPFKALYPTTRVILDCTEIFIENPSDFRIQSDTYSSYKSHNTAKGLVGITPNGFVSYVSDLAPGRVSDKQLTFECGLLEKFDVGDSVMADRGFVIEEMLANKGVCLNIPPFLNGAPQLSQEDEAVTRQIANLRIHVERVISGIKNFRILKTVFSNSMHDKLEQVWKLCCLLNNFTHEPLLDRK